MHIGGYRDIYNESCPEQGVLFRRYFIFSTKWFGIYVHNYKRSDSARAMHDHPWTFISIILKNGYFELVPQYDKWGGQKLDKTKISKEQGAFNIANRYKAGAILYRPANFIHSLQLIPKEDGTFRESWSIIFRGPVKRSWGFWVDNKWVQHSNYDTNEDC